ncbi:MAG: GNAT family N-acetyltransferase [Phycisphaerales bacterium]
MSGRLVAAATGGLVPEEASVAQALLEPLDGAAGATAGPSNGAATTAGLVAALDEDRSEQALHVRAFLAAGFAPLAVLDTMVHVVTRRDAHPAAARDAARATIRPWTRGDPVLVRVLEASYEATRDCPGLCGLRRTEDIIAGHLASGRYEPSLWSILHVNGVPSGALLLGASHAGDGLDLIYLGLAAAVRGRGYGALLVEHAVRHAAARREPRVCLAVDRANTPAVRLYERFGFRATTSRLAMIRRVRALDPPRDDASPRSQGADDQSR